MLTKIISPDDQCWCSHKRHEHYNPYYEMEADDGTAACQIMDCKCCEFARAAPVPKLKGLPTNVRTTRPDIATYMAKWSKVNVVAHEQERSAREEFYQALITWQYDEIERLTKLAAMWENEYRIEHGRVEQLTAKLIQDKRATDFGVCCETDGRLFCTLSRGHDGAHVAHAFWKPVSTWANDSQVEPGTHAT